MEEERAPTPNFWKAIGVAVALALIWGLLLPSEPDAVVIAAITEEVEARACISQGAIWEKLPKPVCALGTRDVPATALSYPLASQ